MPEVESFTNPLSGSEVVADVLAQIKKRLATDCNLRATDGYSGGYSGTVTIKLNLHAVRITPVEMEVSITAPVGAPKVDAFPPEDVIPVSIEEKIAIPLEPNLKEVRIRTTENNAEAAKESEPTGESEAPIERKRRRYAPRELAGVGAVSE